MLDRGKGKEISLNETMHRAYKSIIITEFVGFLLAGVAAVFETGLLVI